MISVPAAWAPAWPSFPASLCSERLGLFSKEQHGSQGLEEAWWRGPPGPNVGPHLPLYWITLIW